MNFYSEKFTCKSEDGLVLGTLVSDDDDRKTGKPIAWSFCAEANVRISQEEMFEIANRLKELNE